MIISHDLEGVGKATSATVQAGQFEPKNTVKKRNSLCHKLTSEERKIGREVNKILKN